MQATDRLLKDKDAAEALGVSKSTFWRRVNDGTVPQPVRIGASTRWSQSEIQTVIERAKAARMAAA